MKHMFGVSSDWSCAQQNIKMLHSLLWNTYYLDHRLLPRVLGTNMMRTFFCSFNYWHYLRIGTNLLYENWGVYHSLLASENLHLLELVALQISAIKSQWVKVRFLISIFSEIMSKGLSKIEWLCTLGVGNLFIITGCINCGLSLAGHKINFILKFYLYVTMRKRDFFD